MTDQFQPLGLKFVKKYMRQAQQIANDNDACYSRQLGVVLVKVYEDGASHQVGGGYNGPPRKTPHCDSEEYLGDIVWPQLTEAEKAHTGVMSEVAFLSRYAGCKTCPRRLIGAGTGLRTELCSCQHAERNAIYNATGTDLHDCWAFCWTGVPCTDCAGALIQVGIKHVFCLKDASYAHGKGQDYSFGARWLLAKANISLFIETPEFYLSK